MSIFALDDRSGTLIQMNVDAKDARRAWGKVTYAYGKSESKQKAYMIVNICDS